jgi:hypothetical protein
VKLEAHLQLGDDSFVLMGLDNACQNDWCIVLGSKDFMRQCGKRFAKDAK